MGITIIGIDCATQPEKVGLALALFDEDKLEARINDVRVGNREGSVVNIVAPWIRQYGPALLALDAPLGWPKDLRQALRGHKAGKPIQVEREKMFHRKTDEFVRDNIFCVIDNIRKMPLEVGADRIARTAYSALDLLHKLRAQTGQEIRLAWKREDVRSGTWAIEVYPAGTLAAHQIDGRQDYKRKDKDREKARRGIVEQLKVKKHLKLPSDEASLRCLLDNDDALDAAICVLAGVDFLARDVLEPKDAGVSMEVAKKEGWIWVKKPV